MLAKTAGTETHSHRNTPESIGYITHIFAIFTCLPTWLIPDIPPSLPNGEYVLPAGRRKPNNEVCAHLTFLLVYNLPQVNKLRQLLTSCTRYCMIVRDCYHGRLSYRKPLKPVRSSSTFLSQLPNKQTGKFGCILTGLLMKAGYSRIDFGYPPWFGF